MLTKRKIVTWASLFLFAGLLTAFQRGRFFEDQEEPTPSDAGEKTEWQFARLSYDMYDGGGGRGRGRFRGAWSVDYPQADRHFAQGIRRLSRIHTRSVEEVVDLDTDKIFDYPWVYAVEVGHWDLSDSQAARLREYLNRGGFLVVDDFHGSFEWEIFVRSLQKVFRDRPIVDIPDKDPIFHILFDLDQRVQIPGVHFVRSGRTYEQDGVKERWAGVYDEKGRIQVAICHNMDLGDAWEHADLPEYPERYTSMAYRIGLNYIIYAMTR